MAKAKGRKAPQIFETTRRGERGIHTPFNAVAFTVGDLAGILVEAVEGIGQGAPLTQEACEAVLAIKQIQVVLKSTSETFDKLVVSHLAKGLVVESGPIDVRLQTTRKRAPKWKVEALKLAKKVYGVRFHPMGWARRVMKAYPETVTRRVVLTRID